MTRPHSNRAASLTAVLTAVLALLVAMLPAAPRTARAQEARASDTPYADLVAWWIALDAPTGRETIATDVIRRAQPGWTRDSLGNLVMHRGSGSPRRVVACALDRAPFMVSAITDDGYLRLQMAARVRQSRLWAQFHQGQRVRILTRTGARPGVVGVQSIHLAGRGAANQPPAQVEDLWVDVGARSRAEVDAMGIALLDPVEREWHGWGYGDGAVSGPNAGARAGCAAVAAAASRTPQGGETWFVISAQSAYSLGGLAGALAHIGDSDTLTIVDPALVAPRQMAEGESVVRQAVRFRLPLPITVKIGSISVLAPVVRHQGTLVETLNGSAIHALLDSVAVAAGVTPGAAPAVPTVSPSSTPPAFAQHDALSTAAELLGALTDSYGVSGHEDSVRANIQRALPAWARDHARADSAGNLVLAIGPDRDTVVVVAHMDEVGFEVTGVSADGTLSLRTRGGFYRSLWEGQPALLHLGHGAPLRGIFIPRDSVAGAQPGELTAWFGLDSAALTAAGVRVGDAVTSVKHATRMGTTRFSARSIDDRAGCTALVLAVRSLDPATLKHKVIFVWSTREEIGLEGAQAVANQLGVTPQRVYAIDTFVSSDSPLDDHRFANALVGHGPVVRAVDNSSVTPPTEVDRVLRIAHSANIPIQVGTTNGGNDGSAFTKYGVVDVPIGWPLRYSHSPAEVVDLGDIVGLGRIVAAVVKE
ncbi:MAG TPA: M20/M25/M40 family metallo-hydrolase [Gemmatimonadaceae bacterium]|nr:M20/M25/M40 family metallo-hydrolase [Gemmatimonadaceae bacterium]